MSSEQPVPAAPRRREPATVRVAMWSARHRWPVVGLWFAATIGLFIASLSMGGINAGDANGNPNDRKLEASRGLRRLQRRRHQRSVRAVPRGRQRRARRHLECLVQGGRRRPRRRPSRLAGRDQRQLDADLRSTRQSIRGPTAGRPHLGRRDDGSNRHPGARRGRPGPRAPRAGAPDRQRGAGGPPRADHPRHQQHVHQRRHQRADLVRAWTTR